MNPETIEDASDQKLVSWYLELDWYQEMIKARRKKEADELKARVPYTLQEIVTEMRRRGMLD